MISTKDGAQGLGWSGGLPHLPKPGRCGAPNIRAEARAGTRRQLWRREAGSEPSVGPLGHRVSANGKVLVERVQIDLDDFIDQLLGIANLVENSVE